jgi:uracil-DNA glycosylase
LYPNAASTSERAAPHFFGGNGERDKLVTKYLRCASKKTSLEKFGSGLATPDGMMKQKRIETHKIGLVGQAPSRRGDPRKPLAGPNGRKIARLAGISYDELIACRRKHLNGHYNGKRPKGDAFDHAKGNVNAADVLLDWRVERIVLLGKNVARCFGFRDLPFLAEISLYGRRFLIFPHPSRVNRWWNERRNEQRARQLLQRFLRGETGSLKRNRPRRKRS